MNPNVGCQSSKMPPLPTVEGEEGEGEQIDFVHPHPTLPHRRGRGYAEESSNTYGRAFGIDLKFEICKGEISGTLRDL